MALVPNQIRFGKTILKIADEQVWIVSNENGTYTFLALCHENRPERAFPYREENINIGPAFAEL